MGTIRHTGSIRGPRPVSSASIASAASTMTRQGQGSGQGQALQPIPQGQEIRTAQGDYRATTQSTMGQGGDSGPNGRQEEPEEEEDLMLESVIIPAIASVSLHPAGASVGNSEYAEEATGGGAVSRRLP
jgi:hypothetical protein